MGGVGPPIIGRPRPLPGQRRADPDYTLNCEEPDNDPARLAALRPISLYELP
jgi:hypothetical protein